MKVLTLFLIIFLLPVISLPQNIPACDSLVIECCSFDVNQNTVTLIASNYSSYLFDYPGFISNRVLMPMINEAIFALMEGVASAQDIDTVMKLGMNHPMGPLTLADFIGLDVCLAIMEVLYNGYNDSKYRPCPLLKKMVAAKKLGRKTGEGFFKYDK